MIDGLHSFTPRVRIVVCTNFNIRFIFHNQASQPEDLANENLEVKVVH